jgi:Zn-finger protein
VKLIHDRNGNGIWDTGDYLMHIQPEAVEYYKENITVRANWDVDIYIKTPLSNLEK